MGPVLRELFAGVRGLAALGRLRGGADRGQHGCGDVRFHNRELTRVKAQLVNQVRMPGYQRALQIVALLALHRRDVEWSAAGGRLVLLRRELPTVDELNVSDRCAACLSRILASRATGSIPGSEVYLVLPARLAPPREHATTIVGPGDVGFLTVEKGSGYGIEEDYSEVCWFYDLDATPSMLEGPITVNVFADSTSDADAFLTICRCTRVRAKRREIARG